MKNNKTTETVITYSNINGEIVETKREEWSSEKCDYVFDRNISKQPKINEVQHLRNILKM